MGVPLWFSGPKDEGKGWAKEVIEQIEQRADRTGSGQGIHKQIGVLGPSWDAPQSPEGRGRYH